MQQLFRDGSTFTTEVASDSTAVNGGKKSKKKKAASKNKSKGTDGNDEDIADSDFKEEDYGPTSVKVEVPVPTALFDAIAAGSLRVPAHVELAAAYAALVHRRRAAQAQMRKQQLQV